MREAVQEERRRTAARKDVDGCLKVVDTGTALREDTEEMDGPFLQHLWSYGGEWLWNNLCSPDGIEWIPEAMSRGTLTCVTDGSYIRHLVPNISGAGWIVQG